MKALLGGLVGGTASGATWLALEHFTQTNLFWMVILVGLVTGLSVLWAGGSSKSWGTARGALALALTMAVIAGGRQVYAKFLQSTVNSAANALTIIPAEQNPDGGSENEAVESHAQSVSPPTSEVQPRPMGLSGPRQPSIKQHFSDWDLAWMSLAALAAYICGKGGQKSPVAIAIEQSSEDSLEQEDTAQEDEQLK